MSIKRFLSWTIAVAVIAVILGIALPGHRGLVFSAGVVALLAGGLAELAQSARSASESEEVDWTEIRTPERPREERPSDLEHLERTLGWGRYSSADFRHQVRPVLRGLVTLRLREGHGVDLDASPDDARRLLSPNLWDAVVAPADPTSEHIVRTVDVARLVDEIEVL
jgi:hypothetical protein